MTLYVEGTALKENFAKQCQILTFYQEGTALKENLTKQCQISTLNIKANKFWKNGHLVPDYDFPTSLSSIGRRFHQTVADSDFPARLSSFERKISQTVPDFYSIKVYTLFP